MILVFGASGTCGAAVTRALVRAGKNVRGFVRNEERATLATEAGASEVITGDLRDRKSIERALQGVDGVFYVAPRFIADEAFLGRMVVELASQAGVKKFVYQSAMHSSVRKLVHHEFKREVEESLYSSPMDFTILQPTRMMHNIAPSLPKVATTGVYAEPFSADVFVSDVDYGDVAEVAALAFARSELSYTALELVSEVLNRHERVAILSEVLKRPVRSGDISVNDWLTNAKVFDPYECEARIRMFDYYDRYGFKASPFVLQSILGRAPKSYRSFINTAASKLGLLGQS